MQVCSNSCFVTLSQHFRFAQFFISPLLKEDTVEREIQAVESGKLEPTMQESTNTFFVVVFFFLAPSGVRKIFCTHFVSLSHWKITLFVCLFLSEYRMSYQSDSVRKMQLLSLLVQEGHPFGKFLWGELYVK